MGRPIEEVINLAGNSTCRVKVAGAKVLIPLVLLSFGIVAITDSHNTQAIEPNNQPTALSAEQHEAHSGSEPTEEEPEEPQITLPHPYNLLVDAANKHELDPALVLAVAATESNFKADAVSGKGAIGIMQLMPSTAQELGINPYILEENIEGGVRYLSKLMRKYGDMQLALAAYNAGMGIVDRYGGVPPFKETQNYIKRVLRRYGEYSDDCLLAVKG
ncbi:MAG TPA: lytic transglycosylase domain-containing protein [Firmicutes bacterium]|jgi:soluble lytic murein transglycosylase-like protein|nr:lytic transglycosylase domain-containing protein [Bacillota bacterium]